MNVKVILFDIGGVLVELAGVKRLIELMGGKITHDELSKRWSYSEYVRLYESGKCSTETFAKGVVRELDMDISPDDFIGEYPLYAKDFFPNAAELLRELAPKYTLACLSNTSIAHWTSLRERISIDKYFRHSFLSYEIGLLKPELAIYTYVIEKLGCRPDEIIFFDDNEENIRAALKAGMNAYRVTGFEDLKEKLGLLDLI